MRIIEPSTTYLDPTGMSPYQFMEKAGRTCYKSEANITDESAVKFVRGLKKSGHTAMLEHSHIILSVSNDIAVPFIESIKNNDFDVDGTKVRIGNYLNITECGPVFVISGSFRAFFALYDERFAANKTSNAVKLVMKKLNEAFPELFDDVDIKLVDGKIFVMDRETFIKFATATFTPDTEKANACISRHLTHTCKFVCDRGITHEFVRHRPASFAQESTRYCVSGNTKLTYKNGHYHNTVAELYNNKINSVNGSYKRIKIKQVNEDTGKLIYSLIDDIFYMGKKDVYKLTTELGYELLCTSDHEIYTENGYIPLKNLKKDDYIYINGKDITNPLYKDRDWLYYQYITLNKTYYEIAKEFNYTESVIKKWSTKLNIPKKQLGYANKGKNAWNKGLSEYDNESVKKQADVLRKYHCNGRHDNEKLILKDDSVNYQRYTKDKCEICGSTSYLQVHHKDRDITHKNNNVNNLITLCNKCHQQVHNNNLQIIHLDKIISIEYIGKDDVYDISMKSNYHNFVANGIIVHNCNYSKDKFGNEITVIRPSEFVEGTEEYNAWKDACEKAEYDYFKLLKLGVKPQFARDVLPTSVKTEIIITATEEEWQHIINLRKHCTTGSAHPQIIQSMNMVYDTLLEKSNNRLS